MGSDCTERSVYMQFWLVINKNAAVARDFTDTGGDPLTLGIGENGNKRQTTSLIASRSTFSLCLGAVCFHFIKTDSLL